MDFYPTQAEWIRHYADENRPHFNRELFDRDNYEVIEYLKKVALSCERSLYFIIKVEGFRVIENYEEIHRILYNREQAKINRNKNKKQDNPYDYINLKDSDIMLLQIDYFIAVKDALGAIEKSQRFTVTIAVPRIVNKYYYRIRGNIYQAIYQIVDASTYNNTNSNSKKQSITTKTMFMPIRLYRNCYKTTDADGKDLKFTTYKSRIFNKNVPVMEYFLARLGLEATIAYLGIPFGIINIGEMYDETSPYVEDNYHFKSNGIHITVPKYIFDNDLVVQCFVMTLYDRLTKSGNVENLAQQIFTKDFWLIALSSRFTSMISVSKGYSILDSLEACYDIITKESIRLPDDEKKDIYAILRWMVREFNALRLKDNTDLTTKKIRRGEYIAAAYATKLSKAIYRANDQKKITCDEIRRYIDVEPDFLLNYISKDKLVSYRNSVNDNDGITCLKYSYKGTQGIESNPPDAYRRIKPSHIGRVDLDSSSASDPGMTGIICPMAKTDGGSFKSDETEPNTWSQDFDTLIQEFREVKGKRELIQFQKELSMLDDLQAELMDDNLSLKQAAMESAIEACTTAEKTMIIENNNATFIGNDSQPLFVLMDGEPEE